MADNVPTFHHLSDSQSQRILWLLEELHIDYKLVCHQRNPASHPTRPFLSPEALLATGPYGKAPLLITGARDGSRYLPETFAIATYLIRTFDADADAFGLARGDWARDDMLSSVIMTGLGRSTGFALYMDFGTVTPAEGARGARVADAQLWAVLGDLERELREGPPGGFLMGEAPGRCDVMLEFPLSFVKHRRWADLERDFPALNGWLERVYARSAWKSALTKGNGYDPSIFPKIPSRQ